jgi:cell division protein FtsW
MGIVRARKSKEADRTMIISVALMLLIGTVMVYSASAMLAESRFSGDAFFLKRQLIWVAAGVLVTYLLSRFDYHHFEHFSWAVLIPALGLLAAVLMTTPINGARRWLNLGIVGVQPSEIFKYALVIFLSAMLAVKRDRIKSLRSVLMPAFPIIGIGFGLILLEPSLGTVLVMSVVVFILFFVAGVRKRLLAVFTGGVGLAAYLMVFVGHYKVDRIYAWLDSLADPLRADYQVKQSVLAIGSGGWTGAGLGRGSAKLLFLPAPHTDFIFATYAEEGGFIAAMILLLLFAILVYRGLRIATNSPDLFGFYLALGITAVIFCQAALNLMVATALTPVTGLPLPLISYGGSSLILTCAGIGILLNISRQRVTTPQLFRGVAHD